MTDESETHYLETLYKELTLLLGDAVWAFARIEWLTYESLGAMSTDSLNELVGDIGFRARTVILRQLVQRCNAPTDSKKRALKLIGEAEKLANERNIIVHNPWQIWVDLDAREFMTEIQKYSKRDKKLDLQQLRDFVERATRLETSLKEALSAL